MCDRVVVVWRPDLWIFVLGRQVEDDVNVGEESDVVHHQSV